MRRNFIWAVCGLLLAQWALLLAGLAAQSMWVDEWFTVQDVSPAWRDFIPNLIATERRPPLYWALLKLWIGLAGQSEYVMRFFSVATTALLTAAAFRLARLLRSDEPLIGLIAAAWLAFSPFVVLYGRMMRSYALFALVTVAATCWLLRLNARFTRARWFAYTISIGILLYVDYGALAIFGIHGLWLLSEARGRAAWGHDPTLKKLSALIAAAVLFSPWASVLLAQSARSLAGVAADLAASPVGLALKLVMPFVALGVGETLYPWNPLALSAIAVSGLLALLGLRSFLQKRAAVGRLMLSWLSLSILFTTTLFTFVSIDITFLNVTSRTPHLALVYGLLIACGVSALSRWRWRTLALSVVGAGFALSLFNLYAGREFLNPIYALPVRQIVAQLRSQGLAGDLIIAEPDTIFGYYYLAQPGPAAYADADFDRNRSVIEARRPARIWLLTFGRDRTAGAFNTDALVEWLQSRYVEQSRQGYGAVGPSYVWVKEHLLRRPVYTHKLTVRLYVRRP